MRKSKIGKFTLTGTLLMLLISVSSGLVGKANALPADALWLDPSSITLDTSVITVGYKFNVTAWLNVTEDTFSWEVYLLFNATYFNCTRAGYTNGTQSEWAFYRTGGSTVEPSPVINNIDGHVDIGETCLGIDQVNGPTFASLCWVEFVVTALPPNDHLAVNIDPDPRNAFILGASLSKLTLNSLGDTDLPVIPEFTQLALLLIAMAASATSVVLAKKKFKV